MVDPAEFIQFESLLARHVVDGDLNALRLAADSLSPPLRDAVAAIDAGGFRVASLLVMKLRFERLIHGSAIADEWFARDPTGFTRSFERYHRTVPPTAFEAWSEAECFTDWLAMDGTVRSL